VERTQSNEAEADFSIENYGAKTAEKEECEEQLLAEYATLLGFYLASVVVLTGIAADQNRLPRKFSLLDLALLGIATHKLSRIVAKDRITGILRAPFVFYSQFWRGRSGRGSAWPWISTRHRSFDFVPVLHGALVRHSSEFRSAFRPARDAVLRWNFSERNRLGFSSPRLRSNETRVTL